MHAILDKSRAASPCVIDAMTKLPQPLSGFLLSLPSQRSNNEVLEGGSNDCQPFWRLRRSSILRDKCTVKMIRLDLHGCNGQLAL